MIICFLSTQHMYNDTRILLKEASTLSKLGHVVHHFAPDISCKFFKERGVYIGLYQREQGIVRRVRMFRYLFKQIENLGPDVIHCNEVGSWCLASWYKVWHPEVAIVFDVHEHYPSRFDEPHVHWLIRLFCKPLFHPLVKVLSSLTDYFVFAKRSVAKDYPAKDRHEFVFNYSMTDYSNRCFVNVPQKIKQLYEGGPVLVHIGAFSRARGWPELLQALSMMNNTNLRLFCIGTIAEGSQALMSEAKSLCVSNRIRLFERMDFNEMFDHLLCANIGCMVYQPGILNHIYAFPMKLYDYMIAGLPVIGPEFSIEVAPVIKNEGIGFCVDTSSPQSIADALDLLCNEPEMAEIMGKRARHAAIYRYNWDQEALKLGSVYKNIEAKRIAAEKSSRSRQ